MRTAKSDFKQVIDREESISIIEPLLIPNQSRFREELNDLALEVASKSNGFCRSLPVGISSTLAELIRSMNCYYSNLIEGHNTHPVEIEKALEDDFSSNKLKRNLQLEARAHIEVQKWIDSTKTESHSTNNWVSVEMIKEIHRRFYQLLPDELLLVKDSKTSEDCKIIPGYFRKQDVQVGRHIAISPTQITKLLQRFEEVFSKLGKTESIISAAAAHHRFLFIHPFLDGNGRVARLISYATLRNTLDTQGLWSIARGLARNETLYKQHLANCDMRRRNDLDGRGNLSEECLVEFTKFFLTTCIDQINFMEGLVQPDRLRTRILLWAEEEVRMGILHPKSTLILEAILYRGELPRAEIANLLQLGERQSRRVVSTLIEKGVLVSKSSRSPLRLLFSARLAYRWLPGLFPEQ